MTSPDVSPQVRCGTVAGYARHYRAGEPRCQPCKDACAEYQRLRKAGMKPPSELLGSTRRDEVECGTMAAVRRHWRRREQLDEACREASRTRDRGRYANDPVRRETVKAAARAASRAKGYVEVGTLPQRECRLCEGLFTPHNARALYCSPYCWELDNRTTKLVAELRMLDPDARRARIAQIAARRRPGQAAGRGGAARRMRRCAVCPEEFEPATRQQACCSSSCAQWMIEGAVRATPAFETLYRLGILEYEPGDAPAPPRRVATGASEHIDPREVFERDEWTCRLCGRPVPRDARYPDPLSPSLDHDIPLSVWPEGHRLDNVGLAHLRCNIDKGADFWRPQIRPAARRGPRR